MDTSYLTSFNGMFDLHVEGGPAIRRVEIPINQRDYAQGRTSDSVNRIRSKFLDALSIALLTDEPINLDFVYGDMVDGTLRPLDGQQRLTTLFLLHWYLAWRARRLDQKQGWKQFSYATRASARRFCEILTESDPPADADLRTWILDQSWFQHSWQYDPTIQSMLVMLEAINKRFAHLNPILAWEKLIDPGKPAISYHLLPNAKMGLSEDTYIKMNSRGKPLTQFENFKAYFEKILETSCSARVEEFAKKIDGDWTDVLWTFRESDNIVDDELMNYLQFITELCAWREGNIPLEEPDLLAEQIYGSGNPKVLDHVAFLIECFDTWVNVDIDAVFEKLFALQPAPIESGNTDKVVLFMVNGNTVNLFLSCCKGKDKTSWGHSLLLYAVLLHRLHRTGDFSRRLRILRNLIEASSSELRAENMPALINDVEELIRYGKLNGLLAFNKAQILEEILKNELLDNAPGLATVLFQLEEHDLLRGTIRVFEFDAATFERRARAFLSAFGNPALQVLLTGAMLAAGEYGTYSDGRFLQLASSKNISSWRIYFFSGANRSHTDKVRTTLGKVLDVIADRSDASAALAEFVGLWLEAQLVQPALDWRWYFVRYPQMRAGDSGRYAFAGGQAGYDMCMLKKNIMSSYYWDPYLSAVCSECEVPLGRVQGSVNLNSPEGPWFTGFENLPRRMQLVNSGIEMQCHEDGFALSLPAAAPMALAEAFEKILIQRSIGSDRIFRIAKVARGESLLDEQDRVKFGAALLHDLIQAGL